MENEKSPPCTPYKRKARGKENNPGVLSTGLFAGAREGAAFLAGMVVGIVVGGCSVFGPGIGASVY